MFLQHYQKFVADNANIAEFKLNGKVKPKKENGA